VTATEIALYGGLAVALLVTSGFFSGSEVALFGLRRVDREQLTNSGRPVDRLVMRLIGQPKRLVVSVLIGNDLVNMTLAAIATFLWLPAWPEAAPWGVAALAVLVSAAIVILLGEVVPKTLAIRQPIVWARQVAQPLALFGLVITPARWIIHGAAERPGQQLGRSAAPAAPARPTCPRRSSASWSTPAARRARSTPASAG